MKSSKYISILIIATLLSSISVIYVYRIYTHKKDAILVKQTEKLDIGYKSTLNSLTNFSNLFITKITDRKEAITILDQAYTADTITQRNLRDRLYFMLSPWYEYLKTKNIKQLHFHLPNNHSFLRFHKPHKFDDDLSNIRYSVKMANQNKNVYSGFEEGRLSNGFRYVSPLYKGTKHIGSVEASFSFDAIRKAMQELGYFNLGFMLHKSVVEAKVFESEQGAYIPSIINENFLHETQFIHYHSKEKQFLKQIDFLLKDEVGEFIQQRKSFTHCVYFDNQCYLVTFIAIKNVEGNSVAYLINYDSNSAIAEFNSQRNIIIIASLLVILSLTFLVLRLLRNSIKIEKINNKLSQSEEKFRTIANFTYDWEYWSDNDGNFIYVSPSCERITGYSPEAFRENKNLILDIIHPDDLIAFKEHKHDTLENGERKSVEFRIITKSKKVEWIGHHCLNVFDADGKPLGIRGNNRLVTGEKEVKAALRENEQLSSAITRYAQDAIVLMDKNGTTKFWNRAAEKIFGYKSVEVIGRELHPIILPERYRQRFNLGFDQYQATEEGPVLNNTVELFGLRKSGEEFAAEISLTTVSLKDELHAIGIVRDISEKKNIEQELIQAKERAEESDRLKSAFLANMSHEIRTPMNGILGFAQFLKDKTKDREELDRYAEIIANSGKHLLNLINDIIDISKIDAGQVKAHLEEVNLTNTLIELDDLFQSELSVSLKPKLQLKTHIPQAPFIIKTDETRLRQILLNLLSNAVKFTHVGSIELGFKDKGSALEFFVRDTGIGMSEEAQKDIFKRFRQANNSTEKLYGGTGLGLSIAKACTELLKGKIWCESMLNQGTTFYFTIELNRVGDSFNHPEKPSGKITYKGETILIAEDNDVNFEYLSEIFKHRNIKIIRAKNGKEAIHQLLNSPTISLALMDIQMPILDGVEVTKQAREQGITIPIIAQTAFSFKTDKDKCLEAGCTDFISKPTDEKKLTELVYKSLYN